MPYDEALAARVRKAMGRRKVEERRMFGGVAFLVNGHMACGVLGQDLVVRLGDDGAAAALQERHTRPMDFTGRTIRSMLYVEPPALRGAGLQRWVDRALAHAPALPPKRA